MNFMEWFEVIERLGVAGVLVAILMWIAKHYLDPVVNSHIELIKNLNKAIEKSDETQQRQNALLDQIVTESKGQAQILTQLISKNNDNGAQLERIERQLTERR